MNIEEEMERGLASEEVTSTDQLGGGDGGDMLSPVSSVYSSCEESEFDRYCNANSVMGTPSVVQWWGGLVWRCGAAVGDVVAMVRCWRSR